MSNPPSSSSQLAASGAQQQGAGSGSGGSSTTVELGDLKDKLAKWAAMKEKLGTDDAVTHFLSVVGTDSIVDKEPKKEQTRLERAGKSIEKGAEMLKAQKVDSTIQDRSKFDIAVPARPTGYTASYMDPGWSITTPTGVDNPTTLNGAAWSIILDTNKALYGLNPSPIDGILRRAHEPAFAVKPRKRLTEVNATTGVSALTGLALTTDAAGSGVVPGKVGAITTTTTTAGTSTATGDKAGTTATNSTVTATAAPAPTTTTYIEKWEPIPSFEVDDDAKITIKETTNQVESSMAHNGFSANSVSASVSGGIGNWSAAACLSVSWESQKNSSNSLSSESREYVASYNFPRARVFLDQFDLIPTQDCLESFKAVVKAEKEMTTAKYTQDTITAAIKQRDEFFWRFGRIFVTEFQIGGQLTASKSYSSLAGASAAEKRDALKASAAVSIGAPFVSGSASGSHESNDSSKDTAAYLSSQSTLAWSARGGNTLLCANPPLWANSVASFQNWRTLEKTGLWAMPALMEKITQPVYSEWGAVWSFDQIYKHEYDKTLTYVPVKWSGKLSLSMLDGKKLVQKGTSLVAVDTNDPLPEVSLVALDADWSVQSSKSPTYVAEPKMDKLYNEWPLWLCAWKFDARDPKGGPWPQIFGLWVDQWGYVRTQSDPNRKVCRWSLRLESCVTDFTKTWSPRPGVEIPDSSRVSLHCHSWQSGGYRDVNFPPYCAPRAYVGADGYLQVVSMKSTDLHINIQDGSKLPEVISQAGWIGQKNKVTDTVLLWDTVSTLGLQSVSFLLPGNKIQESMDRWDKGEDNGSDWPLINNYRKMYGCKDTDNVYKDTVKLTYLYNYFMNEVKLGSVPRPTCPQIYDAQPYFIPSVVANAELAATNKALDRTNLFTFKVTYLGNGA